MTIKQIEPPKEDGDVPLEDVVTAGDGQGKTEPPKEDVTPVSYFKLLR